MTASTRSSMPAMLARCAPEFGIEIVEEPHRGTGGDQAMGERRADQAEPAGDEDFRALEAGVERGGLRGLGGGHGRRPPAPL